MVSRPFSYRSSWRLTNEYSAKRRAEYDQSLRDRARSRNTTTPRPAQPTSFRSTFVPQARRAHIGPEPATVHDLGQDDLRNIDPRYLFERMFAGSANLAAKETSAQRKHVAASVHSPFDMSGLASHAMFDMATDGFVNKPFKMTDSRSHAHVNRKGRVNVSRSEQSIHVHRNGGMSFSSSTFSGSFGGGNMDMIQSLMGGGSVFGQSATSADPFGQFADGRQPSRRNRHQSFDSPSLGIEGIAQRRPSMSHASSFDDELCGTGKPPSPWSASTEAVQDLVPTGGRLGGLSRKKS